jgi:hypothetical protein
MSQDSIWYQYFKRQILELIAVGKDANFIILWLFENLQSSASEKTKTSNFVRDWKCRDTKNAGWIAQWP